MASTMRRQESVLHAQTLDNGLQMIGQYIPGVQSAASIFWICTGARDERKNETGVSHFLEHMAFRRTEHLAGKEVDRAFESMGAEYNAATSKEMTFYWARVLAEETPRAIELLSELTHPVLAEEDFEQERSVILEEIARYEDQPPHVLMDLFYHDFFGDHPLSWEVLGTSATIGALTVEQMRAYWAERYGTSNVIFSIAGNFEWPTVVRQLEDLSLGWQRGEPGRARMAPRFRPGLRVHQRDRFVGEQIAIGVPSVATPDDRYWAAALLASILGDDTGSRLYWALYQEGLAESATAQLLNYDDTGALMVHISTQPDLARGALAIARREMQRLQELGVEEAELERAKAKLNSSVIIGGESTNERVFGLVNSWLSRGRLETLQEIRERVDAVTLDDLRMVIRDFPLSPEHVITAVGPLGENELT